MRTPNRQPSGFTLLIALSVIVCALIMTVVGSTLTLSQATSQNLDRRIVTAKAQAIALGAMAAAFDGWRTVARNNEALLPTTSDLAALPTPTMADFGAERGYTLENVTVSALTPQLTKLVGVATPVASVGPTQTSYYYLAEATVTALTKGAPVTLHAHQSLERRAAAPWQYLLFYDGALELHPDSDLTLNGAVHSNDTIYTGLGGGKVAFQAAVTSVGSLKVGAAPADSMHLGAPITPAFPFGQPPTVGPTQRVLDLSPVANLGNVSGNNNGLHELIEPPTAGVGDPYANVRFYNQAAVRLTTSGTNQALLSFKTNTGTPLTSGPLYEALLAAITTGPTKQVSLTSITDHRVGGVVHLIVVDVSQFTAACSGVLYLDDLTANWTGASPVRLAFKLINAENLPAQGLTIVSRLPIYVQGDVNTGSHGHGQVPSNHSDPTNPTVVGYTRAPMLIAADSITLLSNSWSDSNSSLALSSRTASNTTYNFALCTGNVPTTAANYSGGAEHLVRLLENWQGQTLTYYGAMACLYPSQAAAQPFGANANVFNPPNNQLWVLDPLLSTNPPPGTVWFTSYLRSQVWFD